MRDWERSVERGTASSDGRLSKALVIAFPLLILILRRQGRCLPPSPPVRQGPIMSKCYPITNLLRQSRVYSWRTPLSVSQETHLRNLIGFTLKLRRNWSPTNFASAGYRRAPGELASLMLAETRNFTIAAVARRARLLRRSSDYRHVDTHARARARDALRAPLVKLGFDGA